MSLNLLLLFGGLALLYFGAEWLVKGAAGLARSLGVPALLVGLTVVGYGTSAPEMTVSVIAALRDRSAMALGNVVGSNIANLGLILGLTALINPPRTDGSLIRREVPLLLATTIALPALFWDGRLSRFEALLLVGSAIGFTGWLVHDARRGRMPAILDEEDAAEGAGAPHTTARGSLIAIAIAIIGLATLVIGGELFVRGATEIARTFGVDDRVIGLTVVAFGTSLPELATSLVAARRGHSDLAVGNVVGSNLYNVLLVLGVTGAVRPFDADVATIRFDLGVLAVMTVFTGVLLRTDRTLQRWEGTALLLVYVLFLLVIGLRR